jgi:hypothetical protein
MNMNGDGGGSSLFFFGSQGRAGCFSLALKVHRAGPPQATSRRSSRDYIPVLTVRGGDGLTFLSFFLIHQFLACNCCLSLLRLEKL